MHTLLRSVNYVWHKTKARKNFRKHGVRFSDAAAALQDPNAMTVEDLEHDEQRFVTIGMAHLDLLVVVHTEQAEDVIRIVSARKADRREQKLYVKGALW